MNDQTLNIIYAFLLEKGLEGDSLENVVSRAENDLELQSLLLKYIIANIELNTFINREIAKELSIFTQSNESIQTLQFLFKDDMFFENEGEEYMNHRLKPRERLRKKSMSKIETVNAPVKFADLIGASPQNVQSILSGQELGDARFTTPKINTKRRLLIKETNDLIDESCELIDLNNKNMKILVNKS